MTSDALLRAVAAAIARLPAGALAPLGALLGWVAGSALRIRRSLVEAAMERAGVDDPRATAGAMYRELGHGLVELLWIAGAAASRREALIARVAIDDEALRALDDAIARGPVVLFASHTGNWELAAAAAARRLRASGRGLVAVGKSIHARGVDAFVARLRASLGVRVVPPVGALAAVKRALAAGDVVVMPIDQVPDRREHGSIVRFLGEAALADRAPATAAFRARATVLVVAAERARREHRVRLLDVAPPAVASRAEGSAARWIDEATARASARLEAFVLRSPASWLWLHRRWRAPLADRTPRARLVAGGEPG